MASKRALPRHWATQSVPKSELEGLIGGSVEGLEEGALLDPGRLVRSRLGVYRPLRGAELVEGELDGRQIFQTSDLNKTPCSN